MPFAGTNTANWEQNFSENTMNMDFHYDIRGTGFFDPLAHRHQTLFIVASSIRHTTF